jgi:hypothetical protein
VFASGEKAAEGDDHIGGNGWNEVLGGGDEREDSVQRRWW